MPSDTPLGKLTGIEKLRVTQAAAAPCVLSRSISLARWVALSWAAEHSPRAPATTVLPHGSDGPSWPPVPVYETGGSESK